MRDLDAAVAALLPAFLPRQRWFGGKAKTIVACEVDDLAEIGPEGDVALAIVGVSYHDESREQYGLLLAVRTDEVSGQALGQLPSPGSGWVVEAASDAVAADALLSGFARGRDLPTRRGGLVRYGDIGEAAKRSLAAAVPEVVPVGAEQSNTSLRVGRSFIFKLFRRLEPGENPELEVGRFLASRTQFRAMSPLEGSLTYLPPDGEGMTLGVLQGWIDSRGDGWSYVLSSLNECVRTGVAPVRLLDDVARLGGITADFHAALGSDDQSDAFRPVPVSRDDLAAWAGAVRHSASRVFAAMAARAPTWPDDTRRLSEAVIARAERVAILAPAAEEIPAARFSKIRIHGDYHLGQTLKTAEGFAIIDFEGEPAIAIARRRQKHCALKDVAGMLRSFDYAIESACEGRPDDASRLRSAIDLRGPFLDAYLDAAARQASVSVPADRGALMRWLALFEFEKALYEFEYEINNRPVWVHIPIRGILQALSS